MNILKIKIASIEQTELGFEHWVDVTYTVPILKKRIHGQIVAALWF